MRWALAFRLLSTRYSRVTSYISLFFQILACIHRGQDEGDHSSVSNLDYTLDSADDTHETLVLFLIQID